MGFYDDLQKPFTTPQPAPVKPFEQQVRELMQGTKVNIIGTKMTARILSECGFARHRGEGWLHGCLTWGRDKGDSQGYSHGEDYEITFERWPRNGMGQTVFDLPQWRPLDEYLYTREMQEAVLRFVRAKLRQENFPDGGLKPVTLTYHYMEKHYVKGFLGNREVKENKEFQKRGIEVNLQWRMW